MHHEICMGARALLCVITLTFATGAGAAGLRSYVVGGKVLLLDEDGTTRTLSLPVQAHVDFGIAGNEVLVGAEPRELLAGSDAVGGYDLWSVSLDGRESRRLTSGEGVLRASWSEARQAILYTTRDMDAYLYERAGQRLVARLAMSPALSPDGSKVAYSRLPDTWREGDLFDGLELRVRDLTTGEERVLVTGQDAAEAIWTPDGSRILFVSGSRTGLASLWRVNVDGTGLAQVTNVGRTAVDGAFVHNPSSNLDARWSPDGTRLMYGAHYSADGEVVVLEFTPGYDLARAGVLGKGRAPSWSARGTVITAQPGQGRVRFVELSARGTPIRAVAQASGRLGTLAQGDFDWNAAQEPVVEGKCEKGDVTPQHGTSARFRYPLSLTPGFNYYYDNNGTSGALKDWKCGTKTYDGHRGTDLYAPLGNNVYCGDSGTVYQRYDGCPTTGCWGCTCGNGFGNHVRVDHGNSWRSIYAHFTNGTVAVALNQGVACGTYLGKSGSSGNSSGPHLHFEVQKYGYPQDDPFAGSCSGPESFWTNQNGGSPTTACH